MLKNKSLIMVVLLVVFLLPLVSAVDPCQGVVVGNRCGGCVDGGYGIIRELSNGASISSSDCSGDFVTLVAPANGVLRYCQGAGPNGEIYYGGGFAAGITFLCERDDSTLTNYYRDADGDGYGDPAVYQQFYLGYADPGYVLDNTDCDDNNPVLHTNCDSAVDCVFIDYQDPSNPGTSYCCGVSDGVCPEDFQDALTGSTITCSSDPDCNVNPSVSIVGNPSRLVPGVSYTVSCDPGTNRLVTGVSGSVSVIDNEGGVVSSSVSLNDDNGDGVYTGSFSVSNFDRGSTVRPSCVVSTLGGLTTVAGSSVSVNQLPTLTQTSFFTDDGLSINLFDYVVNPDADDDPVSIFSVVVPANCSYVSMTHNLSCDAGVVDFVNVTLNDGFELSNYSLSLTSSGRSPEDCGNNVDDDLDGLVDCADSDCSAVCVGINCANILAPDGISTTGVVSCVDPSGGVDKGYCSVPGSCFYDNHDGDLSNDCYLPGSLVVMGNGVYSEQDYYPDIVSDPDLVPSFCTVGFWCPEGFDYNPVPLPGCVPKQASCYDPAQSDVDLCWFSQFSSDWWADDKCSNYVDLSSGRSQSCCNFASFNGVDYYSYEDVKVY